MTGFIEQVETLKLVYEYDRVTLLFLQIIGSLGKYIKVNKGNSHPNAIKVLNRRKQTARKKNDMAPIEKSRPPGRPAEEGVLRPDMNRMAPHETFAYALEEIKQMIKAEFKALRAELKLWREWVKPG